jgi:hypothetical protein
MSAVNVETVSRAMEAVLTREERPVVYHDQATGTDLMAPHHTVAIGVGISSVVVARRRTVDRYAKAD